MSFHLDGPLFRDTFGTPEMRRIFSEEGFIKRFLEVEAALARAEADAGVIPAAAAETITERASIEHVDMDDLETNIQDLGLVSMSIINAWLPALGEAGEHVHYGATSQDIYDTARVLQCREAYGGFLEDLDAIIDRLIELARTHRATPMIGRTHYVHAIPITFGLKVAVWADEMRRHRTRLEALGERLFVLQFFGATGTLAALGDDGLDIQQRLADELDLDVPTTPWFAARDRFAEAGTVLAMIASTAGKLARQVLLMNRPEFGEVGHPIPETAMGSSTMPHKQNPSLTEKVVGLADLVRSNAETMLSLMETVDERSASTLYMEFAVLPELFSYTARVLANTRTMLEGLEVNPEAMAANIETVGDLIAAERVMMALADHLGRQTAHELVFDHAMAAIRNDESFTDRLAADPRVTDHLSAADIESLTDPTEYTGSATQLVDRWLASLDR